MENTTAFNLNKSIEIWKSELSQNLNMSLDNINELESHLFDSIEELQQMGLSPEESLLIAKKRIGSKEELTTEFSKINKNIYFRNRITPYLKGILLYISIISITSLLVNFSLIIANSIGLESENLNYVSIGTLIASSFALLIFSYYKYKNTSISLRKLASIPFLVSTVLASKLLNFITTYLINSHSINKSVFGISQINLNIYNLIFILFILTISLIVFSLSKKENKVKISDS